MHVLGPEGAGRQQEGMQRRRPYGNTWEDHRAAVVKAHGGVGNTGKGKGGKGKAKGKANGAKEAIVELEEEDFATVLAAKLSAEYVATLVETDSADTTGPQMLRR